MYVKPICENVRLMYVYIVVLATTLISIHEIANTQINKKINIPQTTKLSRERTFAIY